MKIVYTQAELESMEHDLDRNVAAGLALVFFSAGSTIIGCIILFLCGFVSEEIKQILSPGALGVVFGLFITICASKAQDYHYKNKFNNEILVEE